jgi:hypothetical protein
MPATATTHPTREDFAALLEESFGRGPDAPTYFTQVFALRDGEGRPNAIAGTGIDVSDRIRADEERRRQQEQGRRENTPGPQSVSSHGIPLQRGPNLQLALRP